MSTRGHFSSEAARIRWRPRPSPRRPQVRGAGQALRFRAFGSVPSPCLKTASMTSVLGPRCKATASEDGHAAGWLLMTHRAGSFQNTPGQPWAHPVTRGRTGAVGTAAVGSAASASTRGPRGPPSHLLTPSSCSCRGPGSVPGPLAVAPPPPPARSSRTARFGPTTTRSVPPSRCPAARGARRGRVQARLEGFPAAWRSGP